MAQRFEVHDLVMIKESSNYFQEGTKENPNDEIGSVVSNRGGYMPYQVKWSNGFVNSYNESDLKYPSE